MPPPHCDFEPEDYVHPTALRAFAQHLLAAKDRVQFVVTTHSPLLLDFGSPAAGKRGGPLARMLASGATLSAACRLGNPWDRGSAARPTMDPTTQLRLSVWKPAAFRRTHLFAPPTDPSGFNSKNFAPLGSATVLKEIYSWDAGPHDIFSACDSEFGNDIRERLLEPFSPGRPPTERGVSQFAEVLEDFLREPRLLSDTHWSDCQEQARGGPTPGDETNFRANVTLAALRHFAWVAQVFRHVPHACVLLR